jgi:hypothetical protein
MLGFRHQIVHLHKIQMFVGNLIPKGPTNKNVVAHGNCHTRIVRQAPYKAEKYAISLTHVLEWLTLFRSWHQTRIE